jgi:hypothetical protein
LIERSARYTLNSSPKNLREKAPLKALSGTHRHGRYAVFIFSTMAINSSLVKFDFSASLLSKAVLREVFVFDQVFNFLQPVGFGLAIYLVMENVEFVLKVIYSNDVAVNMILHHRYLTGVSVLSFKRLMVSKCSTASWVK